MSESIRRRQLLQSMQSRLQTLGNSNRSRWDIFSTGPEMTVEQFCHRICALGIDTTAEEILTLWRAAGISTDRMQFSDFVHFLQSPTSDLNLSSRKSPTKSRTPSDLFGQYHKGILYKFIEADPSVTGYVTQRAFYEIAEWCGVNNRSDIRSMAQKYDDGEGNFSYFKLMSDICYSKPQFMERKQAPPSIDTSFTSSYDDFSSMPRSPEQYTPNYNHRSYNESPSSPRRSPKHVFGTPTRDPYMSPINSGSPSSGGRGRLDPAIFGQYSPRSPPQSPSSGGRGKLDPEIFGQYTPSPVHSPFASPSSGGRGKLDPAIFGEKPVIQGVPEQPKFNADTCTNAERISGLGPSQVIELISTQVSKNFRGGRQAFIRWRGNDNDITANDIRNGLAKDANILLPLRDIEMAVSQYGSSMSLSSFIRMLSDGSSISESHKSITGVRQTTEDEAAIIRIAERVNGDEWEDVVSRARDAEEMCRGFSNLGIRVSESDIRVLMAKLGRRGLINAINSRL